MPVLLPVPHPRPAALTAAWHERRVLWAANPALGALTTLAPLGPPIVRAPKLGWLVRDPVLIRRILIDHRSTSVLGEGGVGHLWAQLLGDWVLDLFDGAGHHGLRTRARDLFTEARAHHLVQSAAGDLLTRLTGRLRDRQTVDVADAARVLVGLLVAQMLGLDLDRFREPAAAAGLDRSGSGPDEFGPHRWLFHRGEQLAALAIGTQTDTGLSAETVRRGREILTELTADVPSHFRDAPPDTVLGRARTLGISEQEATGLSCLLLVAGTETAASGIARTLALLADTGSARRLGAATGQDRAELVEQAVREGLRVTTPAPLIGRHITRDLQVGGRTLRAGERVLCLVHPANTRPGGFDLERPYLPENRQLWFGAGRHLCLGAPVAREELRRMIGAVAEAGPWQVVAREPARHVLIPTYRRLLLRADPP